MCCGVVRYLEKSHNLGEFSNRNSVAHNQIQVIIKFKCILKKKLKGNEKKQVNTLPNLKKKKRGFNLIMLAMSNLSRIN